LSVGVGMGIPRCWQVNRPRFVYKEVKIKSVSWLATENPRFQNTRKAKLRSTRTVTGMRGCRLFAKFG